VEAGPFVAPLCRSALASNTRRSTFGLQHINSVLQTLARNRDRGTARKGHVMFDTSELTERRPRWYRNDKCHGISPSFPPFLSRTVWQPHRAVSA
jgi:hypothetical protein